MMPGGEFIFAVLVEAAAGMIFISGCMTKLGIKRPSQGGFHFRILSPELAEASHRLEKTFGRDDFRIGLGLPLNKGVIICRPVVFAAVAD